MNEVTYPLIVVLASSMDDRSIKSITNKIKNDLKPDINPDNIIFVKTVNRFVVLCAGPNERRIASDYFSQFREIKSVIPLEPMDTSAKCLSVPILSKNQAISPPSTPPIGWESRPEGAPTVANDAEDTRELYNIIIGKLALPGQSYELFPATANTPMVVLTTENIL
ncbi:Protein sarah [Thelohanellus kitauei]|uniref:Protein sarah n=1 Tax=Thelohanellus kitauei TaxID=669202 RepID=A0A0C2MB06_THEKT|nr:Protein sarah [Thelohanellus kitauei]